LIGGPSRQLRASNLNIKAGVGYDFLSQKDFLSTTVVDGVDSTLANWELSTTYLDDFKGQFSVLYAPHRDRRLELATHYEQTAEFIRSASRGRIVPRFGSTKLDLSAELNTKHRYRGQAEFGDSYVRASGRAKLSQPLNPGLTLAMQFKGDGVKFHDLASYNYNYVRTSGKLSLEKIFSNFSIVDAGVRFAQRHVPDSSELSYTSIGLDAFVMAFHSAGELDLSLFWENKDYQYADDRNDHAQGLFDANHKVRFTEQFFSRQIARLETVRYKGDGETNIDYTRFELAILAGWENTRFSAAIGPDYEQMGEQGETADDLFDFLQDYTEIGLRVELDHVNPSFAFCSIESETGRRSVANQTDVYTDFVYERLMLLGDVNFGGGLSFILLLSSEWEWHDSPEDDSRLYLLSSNLLYSF